jgi:DNA polymerase I-like protein with 3'-5' exonuclease and polymerase domains
MWIVRSNELLKEAKIDYWPLAFVHDEMQLSVHQDHVLMTTDLIKYAMKDVEHTTKFRVPLDCDVQTGNNWGDTH